MLNSRGIFCHMKKISAFIEKHNKLLLFTADILVIPALFLCKEMTEVMFAVGRPCRWALLGIECATCGGTRCVSALLDGRIAEAYIYNPLVFSAITALFLFFILLNLSVFFKLKSAKRIIGVILHRRTVYFCAAAFLTFFVARNFIPLIEWLIGI